jgi:hypothetical protein
MVASMENRTRRDSMIQWTSFAAAIINIIGTVLSLLLR